MVFSARFSSGSESGAVHDCNVCSEYFTFVYPSSILTAIKAISSILNLVRLRGTAPGNSSYMLSAYRLFSFVSDCPCVYKPHKFP